MTVLMNKPITFMTYEQLETYNWDGPATGMNDPRNPVKFTIKKSRLGNGNLSLEVQLAGVAREPIVISDQNILALRTALDMFDIEKAKIVDNMKT